MIGDKNNLAFKYLIEIIFGKGVTGEHDFQF